MSRSSEVCILSLFLAALAHGCGMDVEILSTPTRYMDESIPTEEIPLFYNPDFENDETGAPRYWLPRKDREQHISFSGEEVYSGQRALQIAPGPEWYFVRQEVDIDAAEVAGRVLVVNVMVKAENAPNVTVNLTLGDFYQFISERHPNDGNWHKMEIACLVPAWWTESKVVLTLATGAGPVSPVLFDDVHMYVK